MEIRAYDEIYLTDSQNNLGHAADFAIMTLGIDPDVFGNSVAVSDAAFQFAKGNPRYVAGMNGCELTRIILSETNIPFADQQDVMYLDKSPEYWAGWALAHFQWYSGYPFIYILSAVPFSKIIDMYPVYHEMDITKFDDTLTQIIKETRLTTRLRERREISGMSQSELASDSGVPLRQIQLFEQRQRDINKTAALTLLRLARSLHCNIEDLLEI